MEQSDHYFDYAWLEPAFRQAEIERQIELLQQAWRLRARCRWMQLVKRLIANWLVVPDRELPGI